MLVLGQVAKSVNDRVDTVLTLAIFILLDRADATPVSDSAIGSATFLVEAADGGDVLTAATFQEWRAASERVRANHDDHLVDR